jgi:hypothetical protein
VAKSHSKNEARGHSTKRCSKIKTGNPGGDQIEEHDKVSLAFIVERQITRGAIAGNTKEFSQRVKLQTRTSKKARMMLS